MQQPVPSQVKLASEWAWRLLVIGVSVGAALYVVLRLQLVFGVLFAALVFTAILLPLRRWFERLGLHRGLATAATVIVGLLLVMAAVAGIAAALRGQAHDIGDSVRHGVDQGRNWLKTGPLHLTDQKIDDYVDQISNSLKNNRSRIASGVIGATSTAGEILSGIFLTLFTTIFLLHDGERIWRWLVNILPRSAHQSVDEAGNLAWTSFTGYVRGTAIIALVDAVLIGVGIAIVGVPLALPLAVLVFFGAFIPIVGALVSGFVAVAVALATKGFGAAIIVLVIILLVQQLEGHILQPLVMGRSVHLHPLAIVLTVAAGSLVGGIPGAIVAVPFAAIANTTLTYYGRRARTEPVDTAADDESSVADTPSPAGEGMGGSDGLRPGADDRAGRR
jgi:predicted PurR-regulated permease PerM